MIKSHRDKESNLTMNICTGPLSLTEIEDQVRVFYEGKPTLNSLWDFTEADVSELTQKDILHVAALVKEASHSREGGHTALVFPNTMLMGMKDVLEGIAQIEVVKAKIKIFVALDTALSWIKEDPPA